MTKNKTQLEIESERPLASADELAGRYALQDHPNLASADEYERRMATLGFGVDFTDYMAHATWTPEEGWHNKRIEPYGPLSLDPAAAVLHYGQEVFEGLKAYRHADGSVWSFRPGYNAARLNMSNRRLAIPELDVDDILASIVDLVRADERWVPSEPGSSLYLRPFVFASEAFLGVRAAKRYEYLVIGSPSGPYFKNGFQPINVWVDREFHRAGPGGMGNVKTGGNYAASLYPKVRASAQGFDEVLFLDAATNATIDELGGMNVFIVMADGSVKTPELSGNILPGGTRSSIIELLEDAGVPVVEESIGFDWLIDGLRSGEVAEMFACGTAAVVTAIGSLTFDGGKVEVPVGPVTRDVYAKLTDIQLGRAEDTHGWLYRLT